MGLDYSKDFAVLFDRIFPVEKKSELANGVFG